MVLQEGKAPKLTPKWRGPFIVSGRAGRSSYTIQNLDGTQSQLIRFEFHEDSLKPFIPRTGLLRG
ncbi:hypothetical protein GGR56DRAFT_638083 [Xylariaceae sp. FL0804]|nr:hypothetical protein GGR56DRAFT_638083 [Xylariaceae sp. FL0804]